MKNITKNLIFLSLIILGFSFLGSMPAEAQTYGSNIPGCHAGPCGDNSNSYNNNYSYPPTPIVITQTVPNQQVNLGVIVTNFATEISLNSVLLNGGYNGDTNANTTAWFEYGQSVSLGQTTEVQNLTSPVFSKVLSGLAPGTIYYFRAVVQNQFGIKKGDILIVKTNDIVAEVPNTIPNTMTAVIVSPVKTIITNTITSNIITLKIENKFENVSREESVDYSINYKNTSAQKIDDLILKVSLAKDISFEKSDKGNYSDSDHAIILQVSLKAGEEGVLKFSGQVDSNASGSLTTSVIGVYTNPVSKIKENVTASTLNKVKEGNSLAAASIFGNGSFLPDSLIKWIFLVALIFGLMYLGRMFFGSKNHDHEHEAMPVLEDSEAKNMKELVSLKEQKKTLEDSFDLSDLSDLADFEKEITQLEEESKKS